MRLDCAAAAGLFPLECPATSSQNYRKPVVLKKRIAQLMLFMVGDVPTAHQLFWRVCKDTQAVGDELHYVFDCPRFGATRAQYSNLFQVAEGSMRLFMWHKDQKAVSHCLTAILRMAQT